MIFYAVARFFYNGVLGYILWKQSHNLWFTSHVLAFFGWSQELGATKRNGLLHRAILRGIDLQVDPSWLHLAREHKGVIFERWAANAWQHERVNLAATIEQDVASVSEAVLAVNDSDKGKGQNVNESDGHGCVDPDASEGEKLWEEYHAKRNKRAVKRGHHVDGDDDVLAIDVVPPMYFSWLAFRLLVDIVLAIDVGTFLLVFLRQMIDGYYSEHGLMGDTAILRVVGAVLLIGVNIWTKYDALARIKDYAWYWGDFFFFVVSNQELQFGGVFDLVPHPMYTIGYVLLYGLALIAASYTLFVVAALGHACQMLFLFIVEEPHMEKIYGSDDTVMHHNHRWLPKSLRINRVGAGASTSNDKDGEDEEQHDGMCEDDGVQPILGMETLGVVLSSPISALLALATIWHVVVLCLNFFEEDTSLLWYESMWATCTVCVIEGLVLHFQSQRDGWVRIVGRLYSTDKRGRAFLLWRAVCILLQFWRLACYLLLVASSCLQGGAWTEWNSQVGAQLLLFTVGVSLKLYYNRWSLNTFGDFGIAYGDFFVYKEDQGHRLNLESGGFLRYMTHPGIFVTSIFYISLALVAGTLDVMLASSAIMVADIIIVLLVERPHMRRVYGDDATESVGISRLAVETARRISQALRQEKGATDKND